MDRFRAIIVDDEELGREAVREMLRGFADFEVVAECVGGEDAITRIQDLMPDVVFLDIEMPGTDGFDVLSRLGNQAPLTVMVTAYDQYALRAFEYYAIDYLLKPLDCGRFSGAIEQVRQRIVEARSSGVAAGLRNLIQNLAGEGTPPDRLVFKGAGGLLFLEPNELCWVESAGNYLKLAVGARKYVIRETMKGICSRLDSAVFMRVHRSFVVNVNQVREIRVDDSNYRHQVILRDGTTLPVGRSYRNSTLGLFSERNP